MRVVNDIEPLVFENLFKVFNSGILIWQLEDENDLNSFKLTYCNSAADEVTGIDMQQFIGMHMIDSFPAFLKTNIPTSYYRVIKNQQKSYLGVISYGDDKLQRKMYDIKAYPLSHDSVGVVFDKVTVLNEEKNNAKEDRLKYLNLFEGSNEGIITYSYNQKIKDVNPEIEKLLGYDKEEILSLEKNALHKDSPHTLKKLSEAFQKVKKKGKVKLKIKFLSKSGKQIPTKIYLHDFSINGKSLVQCFVHDLSEDRKSKKIIRENKLRLKTLFDITPHGIVIFEKTGRIIQSNKQLNSIFGYEEGELKDMGIDVLLPQYLKGHIVKRTFFHDLKKLIEKSRSEENLNIHGIRKNGKTIPIAVKLTPTIYKDEKVTMASIVDLTFIKKRELELENSNHELEQFSYMATHDLKLPIANIKSHLEILKSELGSNKPLVNRSINWIDKSIQQADRTINAISNVSKSQKQAGRNIKHLSFEDILQEVKFNLQTIIERQNVMINFDFSACSSLYYSHTDLYSILQNLISNAIKYRAADRNPEINLKTKRIKKYCILYVTDNGLGIDLKRHRKSLFKMFKRFHDHIEGTGIGLYMLRKIIEHNGGKIDLESEVNQGTTFKIFFKINDFN